MKIKTRRRMRRMTREFTLFFVVGIAAGLVYLTLKTTGVL